jgi:xanthine dehydrogenase/oxidase
MQGMGWACLEELKWGDSAHPWIPKGCLLTNGPGNYKIPSADDIPRNFRVKLLQNVANTRAVHSSKAVGEPPFHLGATVLFALRNAIAAARADSGAP